MRMIEMPAVGLLAEHNYNARGIKRLLSSKLHEHIGPFNVMRHSISGTVVYSIKTLG